MYGADGEVPQINEEWEPPSGFVEWDEGAPPPGPPAGFPEDSDELGRPLPKPKRRQEPALEAAFEIPRGQCSGCGARFQFEDGGAPGFVPEAAYEKQLGQPITTEVRFSSLQPGY